jgi:hypothetical protein
VEVAGAGSNGSRMGRGGVGEFYERFVSDVALAGRV